MNAKEARAKSEIGVTMKEDSNFDYLMKEIEFQCERGKFECGQYYHTPKQTLERIKNLGFTVRTHRKWWGGFDGISISW